MWKPNPGPQTAFLACPVREILYGGAKGGGKTDAIGPKVLKHVSRWGQWASVLILRESYPQLTEIIDRMRPLCILAGGTYSKSEKTWTFPSGARILFGHASDGCDPYWGKEYSLIVVDEVTRTLKTESDYLMLLGSLRNSHGIPTSVILTSNPGGAGHSWIKERFMSVPPLTVQRDERTGLERVYIPASLRDNPKLPEEYRLTLEQMSEAERKAYLDGDWSAFEGTVFDLKAGVHTWTWAQFKDRTGNDRPPTEWTRFTVMDWGYAHPFAHYWLAVDYDGRAYAYREWYGVATDGKGKFRADVGVSMNPSDAGKRITEIEEHAKEKIAMRWTGPDLDSAGTGDTSAGIKRTEYFQKHGIHFQSWNAGRDSRYAKMAAFHERLGYTATDEGIQEWPGLVLIVDKNDPDTCHHAARTIPALEYDTAKGGEDIDTRMEDHPYDALAAFCLMRPWKPKKPKSEIDQLFGKRRKEQGTWMSR